MGRLGLTNSIICDTMKNLIEEIEKIRKSEVKKIIDKRLSEFKKIRKKDFNEIFKELCFCLLTANFSAERAIYIQKNIDDGFLNLDKNLLEAKLKNLGHRFPNARACFISEARKMTKEIEKKISECKNEYELREWLVKNIKGLGYKEASHFLRNIGFENLAIIDFHIIDILERYKLIKRPKTLTKKKYLEIEKILSKLAKKMNMSLAELDLYLWYLETGKVLK
ncbi:MAG: N-glycosylase/DNA lyase [Candidatus Nanoarchaeia archaeon]